MSIVLMIYVGAIVIDVKELPWDLISIGTIINAVHLGDITPQAAIGYIEDCLRDVINDPEEPVQTEFCLENGKMLSEALA